MCTYFSSMNPIEVFGSSPQLNDNAGWSPHPILLFLKITSGIYLIFKEGHYIDGTKFAQLPYANTP